jgi:hypothetical protein
VSRLNREPAPSNDPARPSHYLAIAPTPILIAALALVNNQG